MIHLKLEKINQSEKVLMLPWQLQVIYVAMESSFFFTTPYKMFYKHLSKIWSLAAMTVISISFQRFTTVATYVFAVNLHKPQ